MTQTQYKKLIKTELQKLNELIDYKIIHGQNYESDSKRHKLLLRKINHQKHGSLFGRLFLQSLFSF